MLEFILYFFIFALVINLIANMIWKYLPHSKKRYDIIISIILIFISIILILFNNYDINKQNNTPVNIQKDSNNFPDSLIIKNDTLPNNILSERNPDKPIIGKNVNLLNIDELSPNAGIGIGYCINLQNNSSEDVIINNIEIKGYAIIYEVSYPLSESPGKNKFNIILDYCKIINSGKNIKKNIKGKEFDTEELEWYKNINGSYEFELVHTKDTLYGKWKYIFNLSTIINLPALNITSINLFFKSKIKISQTDKKSLDKTCYNRIALAAKERPMKSNFYLKVNFKELKSLIIPISDKFLQMLINM